MHEHLVDHHLEEQRRYQGEELQEKGGNEYFAEMPAILVNGAQKPGDVEAPRQIGQRGAPCHHYNATVADGLELGLGHQGRARRMRRLNDHLAVAEFSEQQETAVVQRSDRWHRRGFKPFPANNAFARLKTEFLGAAQHFWNADPSSAEAMTDLLRIGPDAVKMQEHDQGDKARVSRRTCLFAVRDHFCLNFASRNFAGLRVNGAAKLGLAGRDLYRRSHTTGLEALMHGAAESAWASGLPEPRRG